jgi:dTDP-4-dehydrorhamnose 3,5-epimerase-like enzyme
MTKKKYFLLENVELLSVQRIHDDRGLMTVVSESAMPFSIKRIFSISSINTTRGNHAHKDCSQFLVCLSGSLDVIVNDGKTQTKYNLNTSSQGLLIPPGIWAHQEYGLDHTMINVYCDQEYKESDYIRNFDDYIEFRNKIINK